MRVLILGGTGFIGPAFAEAAVARGHQVAVFNRGKSQADLPAEVERLIGDRSGDLSAIKGRDWDAVFDLATYVPSSVRRLGEALKGRVKHYTFISTIMTYKFPGGTDENSQLFPYRGEFDPYEVTSVEYHTYGPLKVMCEQEGEKQFPGRTLALRPGTIVGPREVGGFFTYLVARMERGGEVLAAGDPLAPVQLIDVRDLAEWAIRMAEQGKTGVFNTIGPATNMGWAELLGAVRSAFSVATKLTWVPLEWMVQQGVGLKTALLFWPAEFGLTGLNRLSIDKAIANGITFRPLQDTVRHMLAWYKSLPAERQRQVLVKFDDNTQALEDTMAREADLLAAWRDYKGQRK
jgi:2'-hydroxyisoflavone reductase